MFLDYSLPIALTHSARGRLVRAGPPKTAGHESNDVMSRSKNTNSQVQQQNAPQRIAKTFDDRPAKVVLPISRKTQPRQTLNV